MTRRIHAGAAVGLLLVTTACGATNTIDSGGPDRQTASTMLPSSVIPPPLKRNQATPDPAVVDLYEVHWDKATAGPDTGLVIQYTASGLAQCSKLGRVDVTETDRSMTVKVLLGQIPGFDCTVPQPMIAAIYQTVVELKAPVGDRKVE